MLSLLDRDHHGDRLADLLQRFRIQESSMTRVLEELQTELEFWSREANLQRGSSWQQTNAVLRRCADLQAECDQFATDLVHVRMAVAGAAEELAEHQSRTHQAAAAG